MPILEIAIDAQGAITGARTFDNATDKIVRDSTKTKNGVKSVDDSIKNLGARTKTVSRIIGGLFAGVTATAAINQTVRTIAGFEQTLATLSGVAQLDRTSEQFIKIRDTARELGATTRFSAREAAEGMLFLARAGFDAEEQIASVGSTLDLAAASGIALASSADIASNVLSQFRLEASETNRIADVFVTTTNNANTDVRQLAEAMKFAGPIAGSLGQQVENTAAAIGILGDSGLQAGIAGRSMRGSLAALLGPSKEARDALERLGITLDEIDPSTRTLTEIFRRFGEANLQAKDALDIFSRQNAAAAIILSANASRLDTLTQKNEENTDAARRQARVMSDTLEGAYRSLISAIQEAFLVTGDSGFAGALRSVIDTATNTIRVMVNMEHTIEGNINQFYALASASEAVGAAIATMITATIVGNIAKLIIGIGGITGALNALRTTLIKNPIGVLALALSTAVGLFTFFNRQSHRASQRMTELDRTADRAAKSIDAMAEAQRRLNLAIEINDSEEQNLQLREQIDIIKDQIDSLDRLRQSGERALPVGQFQQFFDKFKLEADDLGGRLDRVFRQDSPVIAPPRPGLVPRRQIGGAQILSVEIDDVIDRLSKRLEQLKNQSNSVTDIVIDDQEKLKEKLEELNAIQQEEPSVQLPSGVQRVLDQLELEASLIGRTNDERERAIQLEELLSEARLQGGVDIDALTERYDKLIDALKQARDIEQIGDEIGQSFSDAFVDMAIGAKTASEAIRALGLEILRSLSRKLIGDQIASFISSAISSIFAPSPDTGSQSFQDTPFAPIQNDVDNFLSAPAFQSPQRAANSVESVVNVTNQSSNSVQVSEAFTQFDGKRMVTDVILRDLQTNGPIRQSLKGQGVR